jgi:hypothetical protein
MTDYTESERIVAVNVEIPLYGSDIHVDRMRERLQSTLVMHFPDVKITDIETKEQAM